MSTADELRKLADKFEEATTPVLLPRINFQQVLEWLLEMFPTKLPSVRLEISRGYRGWNVEYCIWDGAAFHKGANLAAVMAAANIRAITIEEAAAEAQAALEPIMEVCPPVAGPAEAR